MFVDCTAFGRLAETIKEYCKKGKKILIEGRLKYETWEDKTGSKRSKHTVTVDNFQFLDGGARSTDRATKDSPKSVGQPFGDDQQFTEDDIPF